MDRQTQCSSEMLEAALTMEEKGQAFYKKAASSCRNPQCREVFAALIKDEVIHISRIKQIHDSLTASSCWSRDWEAVKGPHEDFGALFRALASKARAKIKAEAGDLEAIDVGLDFELASINFYRDHRAKAVDPLEAAFLDQMIIEEKGHWQALKDTRYYLTDPEGWFMEKERAGLDGD
jgi:rubrerythrin